MSHHVGVVVCVWVVCRVVWMRGVWCGDVGKGVCWDPSADSEPEKC